MDPQNTGRKSIEEIEYDPSSPVNEQKAANVAKSSENELKARVMKLERDYDDEVENAVHIE